MRLKFPIGYDDFKEVREGEFVYVDKSHLIEGICERSAQALFITRPRRFGKTMNMSMLAHFFDLRFDNRNLFRGLAIETRPCFDRLGSAPVLFMSFKDLKAKSYELFLGRFRETIAALLEKHRYVREGLNDANRRYFDEIENGQADEARLMGSLTRLTEWLQQYHGQPVMVFIDEYDSPIHEGYATGYYQDIISFMRGALGSLLKGNSALNRAVLTGILRVAKESIFSDLNNLEIHTVTQNSMADKFGFTETETSRLLHESGCQDREQEVRHWYNGYRMGQFIIYNPWSVLSFLNNASEPFQAYWVNTSGNDLINELLTNADPGTHQQIVNLMSGEAIKTHIHNHASFKTLDGNALWTLLLFSGYLTVDHWEMEGPRQTFYLRIPNQEVMLLYQDVFIFWLDRGMGRLEPRRMLDALIDGNIPVFQQKLGELIRATLSYYDTGGKQSERIYHAFVLGLLAHLTHLYHIRSNRESGLGRYDVMMIPNDKSQAGIILEFKVTKTVDDRDAAVKAGLKQIATKDYGAELKAQGIERYAEIAVAFCGKSVKVLAK